MSRPSILGIHRHIHRRIHRPIYRRIHRHRESVRRDSPSLRGPLLLLPALALRDRSPPACLAKKRKVRLAPEKTRAFLAPRMRSRNRALRGRGE